MAKMIFACSLKCKAMQMSKFNITASLESRFAVSWVCIMWHLTLLTPRMWQKNIIVKWKFKFEQFSKQI